MPLFRRSDGTLLTDLTPLQRIGPYVMRGRNASVAYGDLQFDLTRVKKWLLEYNRALPAEPATIMHLALYGLRGLFDTCPQLNRFVSGGRIYQHTETTVSLTVKESLQKGSPAYAVKLPVAGPGEPLPEYSRRVASILQQAREHQKKTERLITGLLRLPGFMIRIAMAGRQWLDDMNLLPVSLIRDDPLYTSCFLANVGSIGLTESYHHLYETGTCSLFIVLGSPRKIAFTDWDGTTGQREVLPIRMTVDERVADGFEFAIGFQWLQRFMEDPAQYLGLPQQAAQGVAPAQR